MNVSNKVAISAGTATVVAGALATLALAVVKNRYGIDVPPDVRDAVGVVLAALLTGGMTLAAGWLKPETHPAPSAIQTIRERNLA